MNLAINRTAIMIVGITAAVVTGYSIGSGAVFIPTLLTIGVMYWLVARWLDVPLEAPLLAFLLFGYIVGNRGFAQITTPGLPIFIGELGLGFTGILMALRIPLQKKLPFALNPIGLGIIAWIVTSSFHLMFDLREWGIYAVRDYAMVYYAAFFFAGQSLAHNHKVRDQIHTTLAIAFCTMPILLVLFLKFESFFLHTLTYKNNPIIYYKGDLVGIFGTVGHLFFFFKYYNTRNLLYLIPSCLGLLLILITLSRAAMLALCCAALLLIFAKIKDYFKVLAAASILMISASITITMIADNKVEQTQIYGLFEHMISMVDFTGTMNYQNDSSRNTGDNNRYRLVWWGIVIEETFSKKPLQGFGFGYNLANPFVEAYYVEGKDNFSVRSPHNFLLTTFGRTGLIGITTFLAIILCWASQTIRLIHATRQSGKITYELSLHIYCWVIFIGACVGVVLEGPMGAIPFWLLLGLSQPNVRSQN